MTLCHDFSTVLLVENVSILVPYLLTITVELLTPLQSGIPISSLRLHIPVAKAGCTHHRLQGVQATKFCRVAPNGGFSIGNFLHVILMALKVLRWRLDIWKICATLYQSFRVSVSRMTS